MEQTDNSELLIKARFSATPKTQQVTAFEAALLIKPPALRGCLTVCLTLRYNPTFVCERPLPVVYKGLRLDCGYRVDLIVADEVVVKLKTVDAWRRFMTRNFLPTCAWVVGKWVS